jgi:hypothetical protein
MDPSDVDIIVDGSKGDLSEGVLTEGVLTEGVLTERVLLPDGILTERDFTEGNLTQFLNELALSDSVGNYICETKNSSEISTYKCIDGTIHCKSIRDIISAGYFYACLYSKKGGYFMVPLGLTYCTSDKYVIKYDDYLTGKRTWITTTANDLEYLIGCKKLYIATSN